MAPPPRPAPTSQTRLTTLIAVVVVVAALHLAREVLVPLALAVLFSFLLSPLVDWLERRRLPRVPSVLIASAFCSLVFGVCGYLVARQGYELATKLPEYRNNIEARWESLRPGRSSPITKAREALQEIGEKITKGDHKEETGAQEPAPTRAQAQSSEPEPEPVPVAVVAPPTSPLKFITDTLGGLLAPLATAGIVFVLVLFMLIRREDLRDRFIYLVGRSDLHVTTQALSDASARVSRYLLMQLVVNSIYAVPIGIGLSIIGLDNAFLWALLGMLLRFIPYVGPTVAAGMPILLSLAVFHGWQGPLLVLGLYVVVELLTNNLVEPWLYGTSTGLSSVAVIAAAVFWTWVWGPIGLLLSTPVTATLVAFGKHVPHLSFLNVLLGDEPVGTVQGRFYQRLLAMDQEEASEIAEAVLAEEQDPITVLDEVVLPGLQMAEQDRHQGRLSEERQTFIHDSVRAIAEMLLEAAPPAQTAAPDEAPAIVCLPARDAADELVGSILCNLLAARGFRTEAVAVDALVSERIAAVEQHRDAIAVVSALPPSATAHARYVCKRLSEHAANATVVVALWLSPVSAARARQRIGCGEHAAVVRSLAEAVAEVARIEQLRVMQATAASHSA